MRYAVSRYRWDTAYRIYVTEALRIQGETLARYFGGDHMSKPYADVISFKPVDVRTGDQIVMDTIKNAGLEVAFNGPV